MVNEEDLLALSGIQHMAFCPRQWALIHVEKQWQENLLTLEGRFIHERADDPYTVEKRKDLIVGRAISIASYKLGLYGVADIVEFRQVETASDTVTIPGRRGFWRPNVVEYKRGRPKHMDCDKVQLCAQSMCLEEMHCISLESGDVFYNAVKHREKVLLTDGLRARVEELTREMHRIFASGRTPPPIKSKSCGNCSLGELCLPELAKLDVSDYLRASLQ